MAKLGKSFLLKDGATTPVVVGYFKSTSLTINGEKVEVTSKSSGGFTEVLAGAGITSLSISASGVWNNTTEQKALITQSMDNSTNTYTIIDEDGQTFSGSWLVTSVSMSGEFNGEQTFEVSLESASIITNTQI